MKDVLKTVILTGILIIICVLVFVVFGKVKYNVVKMLSRNDLTLNDPTVLILKDRIYDELSDEELVTFTLSRLEQKDYSMLKVEPVKINCQVTDKIFFTSGSTCNVMVFSNNVVNEYVKKYFNLDKDMSYPAIQYEGYTCKNDGTKYFCLVKDYRKNYVSYSVLKDAYETKDTVVIS